MAEEVIGPVKVIPPEDPRGILLHRRGTRIVVPYDEQLELHRRDVNRITVEEAQRQGFIPSSARATPNLSTELASAKAEIAALRAAMDAQVKPKRKSKPKRKKVPPVVEAIPAEVGVSADVAGALDSAEF